MTTFDHSRARLRRYKDEFYTKGLSADAKARPVPLALARRAGAQLWDGLTSSDCLAGFDVF